MFEESGGSGPEGAGGVAADESLKVSQAEGAWFVVVAGEAFGVFDELVEGHVLFADVVFEQGACGSFGHVAHLPRVLVVRRVA